ncbi:MAG TPA: hypothetical protein DEG17_11640 [Cyanobacteria bacterium UBA11149]|nr:hypothetical protein [Cyanobacteria bacterium UBA11367]HBE59757.1 hypothetical protein [Cyanobacteria bacterium UBA11366]HBK62074.1 hypothetical protein [Cyanobacteria bacterium UBA11166]HBR74877.1 hypothetical protein [Cyanobacteria bacterium UBA11159]HBS70885.1 hypothetical protein [Cyanobacteria bacterium UBA11153]HBW89500.1 hypothetical protein [Cyanobacteria bacterium UBA11149]HCA94959.1 hypothetical protein [Cyanobacteria bacterium UBA9226]
MSNIGKKRLDTIWAIASYAAGSSTITAAPTPGGEIAKQVILTASDILMYTQIWKTYFEEELSEKELLEMLKDLGLIVVAAAGTAYIVVQGSSLIVREITNWLGPIGWGVSALIRGSLNGLCGAAWAIYCDRLYCQKNPEVSE